MIGEPQDPADTEPPPRPLLSLLFWLALLAAFVCIAGGGIVALYGPRLFPAHAPAPQVAPRS